MIDGLMTEKHREIFARDWQLCFSRHWEGVGRFRASVYLHAGIPEMAIRLCEHGRPLPRRARLARRSSTSWRGCPTA